MPLYARKTTVEDHFGARRAPGGVVLCGRCNCNMAEDTAATVYLVYTDKRHLRDDIPHDIVCEECFSNSFSKAVIV
jgi:hypothetical protein